jgi:hypothetical protein
VTRMETLVLTFRFIPDGIALPDPATLHDAILIPATLVPDTEEENADE